MWLMAHVRKPPVPHAGRGEFRRLRIDAIHHESSNGARGVVFARIAGALKISEDLFVNIAEVLPLGEIVKVHFVNLVNNLPHQLAGLHVVVSVLEHASDHTAAVALLACYGEFLKLREELDINKGKEFLPRDAFGIRRPAAPPEFFRDGRAIPVLHQLQLLVLVVDDFQEEHPAELRDALGVAIDA